MGFSVCNLSGKRPNVGLLTLTRKITTRRNRRFKRWRMGQERFERKETDPVITGKNKGWLGFVWLPMALLLALSAGGLTGILASYYLNNSRYATEVSALATYRPPQVTTIYADDGETVLAEFAHRKTYSDQGKGHSAKGRRRADRDRRLSFLRSYRHRSRIASPGVVFKNITTGRTEGASTITQQLAKNLFLYKDQTYTRKVNEWAVALQIERLYTKRQILEMYMNYVFLGRGFIRV